MLKLVSNFCGRLLCQLLACLPYRWLQALGAFLGRWVARFNRAHQARIAQHLHYAGYAQHQQAAEASAGQSVLEMPWIWFNSVARIMRHTEVIGWQQVQAAQQQGQGVILLFPHLSAFEIIGRVCIHHEQPLTALFRPAKKATAQFLLDQGRAHPLLQQVPTDRSGIRQVLRALQHGGVTAILPDQVPTQGTGVWASFFGQRAYTMTLPSKLAQSTGARIILAYVVRDRQGYRCVFLADTFGIASALTPQAQAQAYNDAMQALIAHAPAQYNWSYKRFKTP